jgi:hypothetical protein
MRRFVVIVMVCALVFVVFTAAASAKSVDRPFKGTISGTVWFQPVGGVLTTFSSAVGNASHMGRVQMTAQHPTPIADPNNYGPGDMILAAANGDEVLITHTGHLELDLTAAPGTWFVGSGSVTIVGGTGRFADASGSVEMILHLQYPGSLDPAFYPWAAWWTWDGTIRY